MLTVNRQVLCSVIAVAIFSGCSDTPPQGGHIVFQYPSIGCGKATGVIHGREVVVPYLSVYWNLEPAAPSDEEAIREAMLECIRQIRKLGKAECAANCGRPRLDMDYIFIGVFHHSEQIGNYRMRAVFRIDDVFSTKEPTQVLRHAAVTYEPAGWGEAGWHNDWQDQEVLNLFEGDDD